MKQLELEMKHFPYQPYMAFMRAKRRALAKANTVATWTQLELKMILRRLVKAGEWFAVAAFGREFILPTVKATMKKAARFILAVIGLKTA